MDMDRACSICPLSVLDLIQRSTQLVSFPELLVNWNNKLGSRNYYLGKTPAATTNTHISTC